MHVLKKRSGRNICIENIYF